MSRLLGRRAAARPGSREEVVSHAVQLLATRGLEAPTVAEVARAARTTPSQLHRMFGSRRELVAAALVSVQADRVAALRAGAIPSLDPRARLAAAARALVEWALDHPGEARLASSASDEPTPRAPGLDPVQRDLATLVRDAVVEGIAPDQDPALVATALDGALAVLARAAARGLATRDEVIAAGAAVAARAIG